jgi:signal transduction histidine kinase
VSVIAHGRQPLKHYGVSALFVIAAAVLTLAIRPYFDGKAPLFFFTLAVLLAAGYGGAGPGFLATALSFGIALLLFRDHIIVPVLAHSSLTFFAVIGVAVSIVLGRLHHINQALARTRDELRLANEKLAEQTETLSRANGELQRFTYAVAHDLNAPLRTISTMAAFCLERSKLDREAKDSLSMVVTSAKRMTRLIGDLLTLARVGHDQVTTGTEVDARRVADVALLYLRKEIELSEAEITIDPLPVLRATESELLRLLQNLLSNGLKYRSKKPPHIRVSATQEGAEWRFVISDNGIGIDPKYHIKIFEPFQRLHAASEYDGSGLGLAICKRIVEQHNGRIWVESENGNGARFYFTMPAVAITPAPKNGSVRARNAARSKRHAGA